MRVLDGSEIFIFTFGLDQIYLRCVWDWTIGTTFHGHKGHTFRQNMLQHSMFYMFARKDAY